MCGFMAAVAFLTRVRVGKNNDDSGLARSVPWFPVVGAMVGGVVGLVAWSGTFLLPSPLAALLAVGLGIWLTGALHEDGLADTFDAFGARTDRSETLRILDDPRLGTYGVSALFLSVAARVAAVALLPGVLPLLVAPASHAIGRGAAVAAMGLAPPARPDGLALAHMDALEKRRAVTGVLAALIIGIGLLGAAALPAVAIAGATTWSIIRWSKSRIGGITGDTLGAIEQFGETVTLIALSAPAIQTWIPW